MRKNLHKHERAKPTTTKDGDAVVLCRHCGKVMERSYSKAPTLPTEKFPEVEDD